MVAIVDTPDEGQAEAGITSVYYLKLLNGLLYFGKTKQTLRARFNYGWGYVHNPSLFNDIMKFGPETVEMGTILQTSNDAFASAVEADAIRTFNTTDPACGYNKWSAGDDNKPCEETREKMRASALLRPDREENIEKMAADHRKAVLALDEDGKLVAEYISLTAAAADLGISVGAVSAAIKTGQPCCALRLELKAEEQGDRPAGAD